MQDDRRSQLTFENTNMALTQVNFANIAVKIGEVAVEIGSQLILKASSDSMRFIFKTS